jgi:hypothetical protein
MKKKKKKKKKLYILQHETHVHPKEERKEKEEKEGEGRRKHGRLTVLRCRADPRPAWIWPATNASPSYATHPSRQDPAVGLA